MDELTIYLLLDCAQIDDPLPLIYRLRDSASVHVLYQRTAYAEWADSGPCLVRVAPGQPLMRHFEEHWRGKAGLLLASAAAEELLVEHLRSLVHARLSDGQVLLFRYYDPRILPLWLEPLDARERDRCMGPVQRFQLSPREGQEWLIRRGERSTEPARYAAAPWLSLDLGQLEALNLAKRSLFEDRLLDHLQRHFPERLAALDAAERQQLLRRSRDSAARHGYSSAEDVARWSSLLLICGEAFPDAAEHAPLRARLEQPGRSPAERLDDLLLAAAQWDKEPAR